MSLYAIPLFIGSLISCVLIFQAWRNRRIVTLRDITTEQQAREYLESLHQKTEAQTAELRQREHYLQILNDITQAAVSALDMPDLLQSLADKMGELIHADACHITLWDEASQSTLPGAASGVFKDMFPSIKIEPGELTMTQSVLEAGHAIPIEDTFNTTYISQRLVNLFPNVNSVLALPFIAGNEKLGAALLLFNQPHRFAADEISRAEHAATQIALAIAKTKFNDAMKRQIEELAVLKDLAVAGAEAKSESDLISRATEIIRSRFHPANFGVYLIDEKAGVLHSHHSYHWPNHIAPPTVPLDQGVVGQVAAAGQPLRLGNVLQHPGYWQVDPQIRSELCVPLRVDDKIIGVINSESYAPDAYTLQDEHLLVTIAGQLATAIKKIQLLALEQSRRKEAETLRAANVALTQKLDFHVVLETLLDFLKQLVPYDSASVMQLHQDGQIEIKAHCGYETRPDFKKLKDYFFHVDAVWTFNTIFHSRQGLLIPDTQNQPEWQVISDKDYVKSWLGMPLTVGNKVFGFFSVDKAEAGFFTENHLRLTALLAGQTAVAIQNAILYQDTQRRAEEMETINNVTAALRQVQTVDDVLAAVLEIAVNVVNGIRGQGVLLEPETGDYVYRGRYPRSSNDIGQKYQLTAGVMVQVINSGSVYTTEDLSTDPLSRFVQEEVTFLEPVKGSILLPLHAQTRIVGVLHVGVAEKRPFSAAEVQLLITIAEIAGNALDRALLLETLEQRIAQRTRDLSQANEQLQELDRLKSKFISDVSHELRTPITNINLYLDLFRQGKPERQPHYMEVIRKETGRLTKLIEDTLSLSRLDQGRAKIKMEPVNLNEIVTSLLAESRQNAESSGLSFTTSLQTDLPLLLGEPNQLAQVIIQLVTNAINYTPSGKVEVNTRNAADKAGVCLEVKDTGLGIDDEDKKHIFERFYRGKSTGQSNIPGTGLGLAIVQEIVELHEGQIELESEPDQGTTFRIYFPGLK